MIALNTKSYEKDEYNQFMNNNLMFYSYDLDTFVENLLKDDKDFLIRKSKVTGDADESYQYNVIVTSPGGKAFEIFGYVLDEAGLSDTYGLTVSAWTDYEHECAAAHTYTSHDKTALNEIYQTTNKGVGQMAVRTNVAVSDLDAAMDWWAENIPSVAYYGGGDPYNYTYGDQGTCRYSTLKLPFYLGAMDTEIRFVENPKALKSTYSIEDFNNYVDSVNTEYGGANEGWSAWYDRHTGLAVDGCSLDSYMFKFTKTGTPFLPHGRKTQITLGREPTISGLLAPKGWGLEKEGPPTSMNNSRLPTVPFGMGAPSQNP
eukprot:FR737049.1.p1 GENE.FR737049.1~~FR737049.1.p1  ORF type:complete len:355 (+),score=74.40 FR737049.1:120-1067(+)